MSEKRIFILGAGFSKQAGMPLAKGLTEPFQKLAEQVDWSVFLV